MNIEKHISELLYNYDCVIVPGFGGFIGNYSHAKIDEFRHLFNPPRKKIAFNKELIQNDGLLANYISIQERIDYSEAIKIITGEVNRYRTEIKENRRIAFENIGVLYLDTSNNLVFQTDEKVNYLPEAFGLSSFYRLPAPEKKGGEQEAGKESVATQIHNGKPRIKYYSVAAAIGALIATAFWFTLNESSSEKLSALTNRSGLSIFNKKESPRYIFSNDKNIDNLIKPPAKDTLTNFIKEAVSAKEDIHSSPFHIVAGCFRVYANALNMLGILQKKNISAAIIDRNPHGLYIVGCGKYDTYNEAEEALDDFRKNVQQGAWVYNMGNSKKCR